MFSSTAVAAPVAFRFSAEFFDPRMLTGGSVLAMENIHHTVTVKGMLMLYLQI